MLSRRRVEILMRIRIAALLGILAASLALADDNAFAGAWKLNVEKSNGRPYFVMRDGVLRIPPDIFKGGVIPTAIAPNGKVPQVFKFEISPDGRTMTVTQPQADPNFRAV